MRKYAPQKLHSPFSLFLDRISGNARNAAEMLGQKHKWYINAILMCVMPLAPICWILVAAFRRDIKAG